ncbi:PIN domain-containing protein [Parapedobacter sp. SGR-10]|uniref:PIN domain-containing protein n=1 Tax=Parapedobacter sp. SGR-10 TaxID=2710879 RepID=UPI0013D7B106|nr:PIN domain-containing protein [Parapedobacter sp. SGR-10]NGF58245.1 PIN domain-containing protein [Parapedobacter sp. SGR-10]
MRVFVDANVIVAVLNRQYPLFPYAAKILSLADNSRFRVYTSPICLAIAFYFAEKKSGTLRAREKIALLSRKLDITTTDVNTVLSTVRNTAVHDFEDGLEYYAAVQSSCQIIVSEDVSDFYFSEIPVQDCETFLNTI